MKHEHDAAIQVCLLPARHLPWEQRLLARLDTGVVDSPHAARVSPEQYPHTCSGCFARTAPAMPWKRGVSCPANSSQSRRLARGITASQFPL